VDPFGGAGAVRARPLRARRRRRSSGA
jgi:hypothetical protein